MSVEIFIARHGQDEDNVKGILNGRRDQPLTELGRDQAGQLGKAIKEANMKFDFVYSSPLLRAFETAQIVTKIADLPKPKPMDDLVERDFGIMTGKHVDEIEKICSPDILKADVITYFLNPDGAETFPQLVGRGHKILDEIKSLHDSGKVLLVCHGDIGKMVYAAATDTDWRDILLDFHFGNGELIDVQGEEAHVIKLEQHNH